MDHQMFRVFVSSTFSDFAAERNVLQKIVFPELEQRCRAKGGTFLGVDLRWGISPQRSLSNRTVTTCLEEIHRCQTLSPKPNFLILLGDRYGWIPLPETIPEDDWAPLRSKMSVEDAKLLDEWYDLDKNALPAVWILKPRTGEWENHNHWKKEVETPMGSAFRRAASDLPEERRLNYCGAATHQEIVRGLFEATDKKHVVAWCRNLHGAPEGFSSPEAGEQLEQLKKDTLAHVGNRGVEREVGYDQISEFQDPSSIVNGTQLTPYLEEFADTVTELLWSQIDVETNQASDLGIDALQERFIREKSEGVLGREHEIGEIRQFLDKSGGVHSVSGPGGQGKTSLLALACRELEGAFVSRTWIKRFAGSGAETDSVETLLASMFLDEHFEQFWEQAILPEFQAKSNLLLSNIKDHLREIGVTVSLPRLQEKYEKYPEEKKQIPPEEVARVREETKSALLRERSELIKKIVSDVAVPREERLISYLKFIHHLRGRGGDLVVVLDGLDQLYGATEFLSTLERLTLTLNERAKLERIWLITASREMGGVALEGLTQEVWTNITEGVLQREGRRLSDKQSAWLQSGWKESKGNPLSLRFGLQRALRMHGFDAPPSVAFNFQDLLKDWIEQISHAEQHGELARRALGLLSVAEHGLPESVLLELLATDASVQNWFCTVTEKTGQPWDLTNGLPPILWSRLRMDLGELLRVSGDAGRSVLRLFHPAFGDELAAILGAGKEEREAIARAAERRLRVSGDAFGAENIPARFFERADPWALKEVVVQWRHIAPTKLDQFMDVPAFAFAVLVLPEAFDAWIDGESSPPLSSLRALLKRYQIELRLQPVGLDRIRLILQEACPGGSLPPSGSKVLSWAQEVDFFWVRNLQPPSSLMPITQVPVSVKSLQCVSGERLAIFLEHESLDGPCRVAVVHPSRLGEAPVFLTVEKIYWDKDGAHRLAKFEGLIEIGDLFVTRHEFGPIRLWRNGREIARLLSDFESASDASGLCALYFAKISPEELLVLYEGGYVAIWALNNLTLKKLTSARDFRASDADSVCRVIFPVSDSSGLAEFFDLNGWAATADEHKFSLMLIDSEAHPTLLNYTLGTLEVFRGSQSKHRGVTEALGSGCAAFWSLKSFSLVLLSTAAERQHCDREKKATFTPIGYSGSQRTLYCAKNYLRYEEGRPKNVNQLVALDWESSSMQWVGPEYRGEHRVIPTDEFSYLLFEVGGSLKIMRLDDLVHEGDKPQIIQLDSEKGFWPKSHLYHAATGRILAWSGRQMAVIDPVSGACHVAVHDSPIVDVKLIGDLVAIAHWDGVLRTYYLNDLLNDFRISSNLNLDQIHLGPLNCTTRIGDDHLITASHDRWLLWQIDSPGAIRPSVLWEASIPREDGRIYHVSKLENGCVTWGKKEIAFWRWDSSNTILKKEHHIWHTHGGGLNCNGMVLELGGNDFLFEYLGSYHDIPGIIGRVRWTGVDESGKWQEGGKWEGDIFANHDDGTKTCYRSIISPVFPDGWVLIGETGIPADSQIESIGAYNIHTEETRSDMAYKNPIDPWLIELLQRHRNWILSLAEQRQEEMLRWGGGVTSESGSIDMSSRLNSKYDRLTDDVESLICYTLFQKMTTQRNFMFRDMLGLTSTIQKDIGLRAANEQNVPYISASAFKVEMSLVREMGMAIVKDRGGRMHWLQIMQGDRPCVGQNY